MLSEARQELRQHFDVNDLNDVNGYIVHAAASGCAHSGNLVNNVGAFDDRAENTVAVAVACLISVEEVIVSNVDVELRRSRGRSYSVRFSCRRGLRAGWDRGWASHEAAR